MTAMHALLLALALALALWFEFAFFDILGLCFGFGSFAFLTLDETYQHLLGELVVLCTTDESVPDCFF